jgi:DNA/RNA endonuclease G (NUC1)
LGGGYELRPYGYRGPQSVISPVPLRPAGKNVSIDNTIDPATGITSNRLRGDYAVPTLFDGNFDAIAAGTTVATSTVLIPGWNVAQNKLVDAHSVTSLAGYFTRLNADLTQADYALKLSGSGDSITHNPFLIPDWGVLRFDVHSSLVFGGSLITTLTVDGTDYQLGFVDLEAIGRGEDPRNPVQNRLAYGVDGFETFTFAVPNEVRGKVATLRFNLVGDSEIYLDNVFFKSQHLLLGNPTEARYTPEDVSTVTPVGNYNKNYLLEKSQFSLSYNDARKQPNWVGWELNKTWLPPTSPGGRLFGFRQDSELPNTWTKVPIDAFTDPYEIGHLAANADRNRNSKDEYSTFVTTNAVPQHKDTNERNSPWNILERDHRLLVKGDDQDIQIFAGGYGSKGQLPLSGSSLNIPQYLWKIALIRDSGIAISDITAQNTYAIAVLIPNEPRPTAFPQTITLPTGKQVTLNSLNDWSDWQTWRVNGNDLEKLLSQDLGTELDFFSILPTQTQEIIENAGVPRTLSAPLMAMGNSLLFAVKGEIGQNSLLEYSSIYPNVLPSNITQVSSGEITPFKRNIDGIGTSQVGSSKISLFEAILNNFNLSQISSTQVGLEETTSWSNVSLGEVSVAQIRIPESSIFENHFGEVSPTQVSHVEAGIITSSFSKIGTAQIDTREIDTSKISPTQVDILQTNSFWKNSLTVTKPSDFRFNQFDIPEIPFPSSVTLQQFLSSHNFNLQNTTIPTWTEFLTGTTPFNLKIEITDLPTGQLAEANITHFDPTGRPTSGTLTLDTDANGLGWFIDSTPWDNAEFGTLNGETLFRATLGSEAYGHYDLLTTILHELGHLSGLISGNPTYDSRVQLINGTPTYLGNGYSTTLTQDRSHLTDPTKLMSTYLAPGMRKLPSQLELQMLADLRNTPTNSSIRLANSISAHQDATPMVGITNGQFDQLLTQWDTRGSIQVTNAAPAPAKTIPSSPTLAKPTLRETTCNPTASFCPKVLDCLSWHSYRQKESICFSFHHPSVHLHFKSHERSRGRSNPPPEPLRSPPLKYLEKNHVYREYRSRRKGRPAQD